MDMPQVFEQAENESLSCVQLFAAPWDTVHGILQARILEWVAFPFSRGSSQPRDRTQVSHIAGRFFTSWAIIPFYSASSHKVWRLQQNTSKCSSLNRLC